MILYERHHPFFLFTPLTSKDVPHCCLYCGWVPIEGMAKFLAIHGEKATCLRSDCGKVLPHSPPFIDPYEDPQ